MTSVKRPGKTRERTFYTLTPAGTEALKRWAVEPPSLPRIQNEADPEAPRAATSCRTTQRSSRACSGSAPRSPRSRPSSMLLSSGAPGSPTASATWS